MNENRGSAVSYTHLDVYKRQIIGYRENYFCDISDCYLDFYNHFIIWSDNAYLNPENYVEEGILKYPLHSIIIADSLQWRKNESNQR